MENIHIITLPRCVPEIEGLKAKCTKLHCLGGERKDLS